MKVSDGHNNINNSWKNNRNTDHDRKCDHYGENIQRF